MEKKSNQIKSESSSSPSVIIIVSKLITLHTRTRHTCTALRCHPKECKTDLLRFWGPVNGNLLKCGYLENQNWVLKGCHQSGTYPYRQHVSAPPPPSPIIIKNVNQQQFLGNSQCSSLQFVWCRSTCIHVC